MPYPNEHACRARSPGEFEPQSFRRISRKSKTTGKTFHIITARLKGQTTMTTQAYRYPKTSWTAPEARAHCERRGGSTRFEPATTSEYVLSSGDRIMLLEEGCIVVDSNRRVLPTKEAGELVNRARQEIPEVAVMLI